MKDIIVHGVSYTPEEAYQILTQLREEYEKNKDKETFTFSGQLIIPSYAKYLIEYLENCLNEKAKTNQS